MRGFITESTTILYLDSEYTLYGTMSRVDFNSQMN